VTESVLHSDRLDRVRDKQCRNRSKARYAADRRFVLAYPEEVPERACFDERTEAFKLAEFAFKTAKYNHEQS